MIPSKLIIFALMPFSKNNTPVWIIFLGDMFLSFVAIWAAYLLRFNFNIPTDEVKTMPLILSLVILSRAISALLFQTHRSIVRLTSTKDVERIFISVAVVSVFFMLVNPLMFVVKGIYLIPYSIIIIDGILCVFLMVTSRFLIKAVIQEINTSRKTKFKVLIYGAGETGLLAKRAIERDAGAKYKVVYYMDDDLQKIGKKIQGVFIRSGNDLSEVLINQDIKLLILATETIVAVKKQQVIDLCLANNTRIFSVPPVKRWINGELSFKQIKKIDIKDLLEREPIKLDTEYIAKSITNKVILVTGAAGSIGSELVRQILPFSPARLILLDQAESPLYELERELSTDNNFHKLEFIIGDIRGVDRMEKVFSHFKPKVVFHAAAYKHVPLMESNPSEALLTNIQGTRVLADLSDKYKVEKFVMVSTDKAVNPTNVMGASKRIAEIYVQSLNQFSDTQFITTRFGNVLGSNGSVIPIFKKQIEKGGPVTVTHPDINRYFMTIPEACQLVLEAGSIGNGGEIFLFDMGESVKIVDLVRKMIKLYGLTVGKDIEIVYTGLRPGEKLYEELLNDSENTLPTHHPQIMKARVHEQDYEMVKLLISDLVSIFPSQNNQEIVKRMKALVPEYKSNNSIFEELDKP